ERTNSPVVDKNSREVSVVARHSAQHASSVLFVAFRTKIRVGSEPQDRPHVVREIPQEIELAGSIVAHRVAGVVESSVLFVVQTHVSGPAQFRKILVEISQEEFKVAAKNPIVFLRKVAVGPVRFHVTRAEHPDKPMELEAV